MNRTHIAFCLDESGSVRSIVRALVDAYNKNVESIRESVLSRGLEATISAFAFGDQCLHHRTLYPDHRHLYMVNQAANDNHPAQVLIPAAKLC